ncbi:PREDICTED: U-box domain-containing protein 54-like [Ipomoea nil]|uniref:U-box domain-containing protein 54-like n=1 Tax=Ipomoea nil TaxID=35883 RepID=UPI0009018FBE|nr:PREDICTED: U-box domain-containing protein 54-like [Ipomoea nil]
MSGEIVEIGEDSSESAESHHHHQDVYVAVGKNDEHVVQWAIDHFASPRPGTRIFLLHIFPSLSYISTPAGKLSRSHLSKEQMQVFVNEESNRRKSLLEKYIRQCNDAKIPVDTMLVESNAPSKAILDLIAVVNITNLIIGMRKHSSYKRPVWKGQGIGEYIEKNAPDFCEVTIVCEGKKMMNGKVQSENFPSSLGPQRRPEITTRNSERKFFECVCFSSKFN